MNLIKIERMYYSPKGEYLPVKGELYVNPDEILSVSTENSIVNKGIHHEVILKDGTNYFISKECFNRILNYNNVWKEGHERPERPRINPGTRLKRCSDMKSKHHNQYAQRFTPHQRMCEIRMDADRIDIRTEGCKPRLLHRIADALESEALCAYTIVEDDAIYLMQPDFGMFGNDDEFRMIVSELFDEENYEIIYKE